MTSESTAEATNAPSQLTLGSHTFRLRRLTEADIGELEQWVRDDAFDMAERHIERHKLTGDVAETMRQRAFDYASGVHFGSPSMLQRLGTLRGAIKMFWLSARHEDPALPESVVAEVFNDPKIVESAMRKVRTLNAMGKSQGRRPTPTRKASPRKGKG